MKRIASLVMSMVLVAGVLTACGSKDNTSKKPESSNDNNSISEVESTGKGDTNTNKGTLTVYSPHPSEAINLGVQEFQDKYGIKVEVVPAGTGELLARIESESANPLGDVFWGGGAESLQSYSKYFEQYEPTTIADIDSAYVDPANYWVGESPLPMVIMYNTNLVPEDKAPTSWGDLLNEEFKGKIAMADPARSGSAYTILLTMIQAYGKDDGKGWDFVKDFHDNLEGKILDSSSKVYKGVNDGEYSVGLTLEKEAIKYVEAGGPVKIVYPSEGTSAVPDGVGLIKNCKNPENAKLFIDFVTGEDCQDIMAKQIKRRPVRNDVDAPEGLPPMSEIKLVDYDFDWAASGKEEILAKWKNIVIGAE